MGAPYERAPVQAIYLTVNVGGDKFSRAPASVYGVPYHSHANTPNPAANAWCIIYGPTDLHARALSLYPVPPLPKPYSGRTVEKGHLWEPHCVVFGVQDGQKTKQFTAAPQLNSIQYDFPHAQTNFGSHGADQSDKWPPLLCRKQKQTQRSATAR